MYLRFYRAAAGSDQATKGDEILSGGLEELFPRLTPFDRAAEAPIYRKLWIEPSDTADRGYLWLTEAAPYPVSLFLPSAAGDGLDAITGSEARYGMGEVVSVDSSASTMSVSWPYEWVRAGEQIVYLGQLYTVDAIDDPGDGTRTLTLASAPADKPPETVYASSVLDVSDAISGGSAEVWVRMDPDAAPLINDQVGTLLLRCLAENTGA